MGYIHLSIMNFSIQSMVALYQSLLLPMNLFLGGFTLAESLVTTIPKFSTHGFVYRRTSALRIPNKQLHDEVLLAEIVL